MLWTFAQNGPTVRPATFTASTLAQASAACPITALKPILAVAILCLDAFNVRTNIINEVHVFSEPRLFSQVEDSDAEICALGGLKPNDFNSMELSIGTMLSGASPATHSVGWTRRFRPRHSSERPSRCIDIYRAALASSETFIYHIDPRTAVAEIYDPITEMKGQGVDAWVVLQNKSHYDKPCFHELALNAEGGSHSDPASRYDNPSAIVFKWTPPAEDGPALILFCVMSSRSDPSIVAFNGFYSNAGVWSCKRCRRVASCAHIEAAAKMNYHEQLLPPDDVEGLDHLELNKKKLEEHLATLRTQGLLYSEPKIEKSLMGTCSKPEQLARSQPRAQRLLKIRRSTALVPTSIRPGISSFGWSTTPSSRDLPARNRRTMSLRRPTYSLLKGELVACTVYQSHSASRHSGWVKPCSKCPMEHNMNAGPDLREYGIFNLNNLRMFTHQLLNEYTTVMSAMEAPFHAFVEVVRKRYIDTGCYTRFAGEDSFRTAWFARSRLLHSLDSMRCEI
ncbi:hypothetical protein BKA62DRAFT_788315 [Auriculariales sp. MPI-PUGE-AT-0066]|nr:hypothetical protein BKA62DRAFT_788315 [Auriculariales sp. MPI-PUGE-AT-0066]